MARLLGIDYGLERTGLAVTDPDGRVVFPVATLHLKDFRNRRALLDKIADIARERQVEGIVLGWPLHLDGSENPMCKIVRNLVPRLKRRIDLPLYLMAETLSTQAARDMLNHVRNIERILDQQAACLILESFLALPQDKLEPV